MAQGAGATHVSWRRAAVSQVAPSVALEAAQGLSLTFFGIYFLVTNIEATNESIVGRLRGSEGKYRVTACLRRRAPSSRFDPPSSDDITFRQPVNLFYLLEVDLLVGPEGEGDKLENYVLFVGLDDSLGV